MGQGFPPSPPSSLTGSQTQLGNEILLNWNAPSSTIHGYKIYYFSVANPKDSVKTGLVTSKTLINLNFNQVYKIFMKSFRVNAPTDTSYSAPSDTISVLVVGLTAPVTQVDLSLVTYNNMFIRIDDTNTFETGFQIEVVQGSVTTLLDAPSGTLVQKQFGNLKPKTQYVIRSRAKYNSLFGPWSNTVYVTTKVGPPPAAIMASDKNCPKSVHVTWSFAERTEDIQDQILKRSTDNTNYTEIYRPNLSSRDFYDGDVSPGTTYYYQLYTQNSSGVTGTVSVKVTTLSYQNANPVTNLISDQSNKSNNHLTLKWTNGAEDTKCNTNIRATNYVFIRLNNSGEFKQYAIIAGYLSTIKIENLAPKTIVEADVFSLSLEGKFSTHTYIRDTTLGPPYAPSDPKAVLFYNNLSNHGIGISWKDNSNDEDYFIVERQVENGPFSELGKIKSNITSFNDYTTEEGVIYYYRIKAGNNIEGESDYSPILGPARPPYSKAPNAPYGLKAKQNGAKVNLTWYDDSIREENYILEKSLDEGLTYSLVATLGRNVTTYTDENVTGGKTYIYRAKAVNTVGTSGYSNLQTIKISGTGLIEDKLNANVYLNPAFESLNIETANLKVDRELTLKVYDRNNRQVLTKIFKSTGTDLFELPISNLGQGMYNVVITDGETSISKKVFKY